MSKNDSSLDPRVRRTRKMLREALIDLIPELGYDAIRIQDITDRATLNRATFYLHYRDKQDLLDRGFDEIWDELTSHNPLPVQAGGGLSLEGTRLTVLSDFQHLAKHFDFYRVMLGENGVAHFSHRMKDHVYQATARRLQAVVGAQIDLPLPLDMVLTYIATAYVGLMQWWLENDMPYSPEEMATMVVELYATSPFAAMGLKPEITPEQDQATEA
ncbi:MAG: TetR/AcrR family transcriptional regulator [Anaerolineales bacterium]|jgi:AcrR family transcriptional regulator